MDIYIRVSQVGDDRTEEESTEIYEAQCREWADRHNAEIGEIVEDTDISGESAVAKRGLERLIQRVESGESDGIVTPRINRFGRNMIEGCLALRRIVEAGGKLIAVLDGFDSTSPGSSLNFNIRMAIAQDFLDQNKAEWQAVVSRAADRGVYLAARVPFGYKRGVDRLPVVVEAQAKIVRELFERKAKGESLASLTRWVREQATELPTEDGKPHPATTITNTGVKQMLKNRAYVGEQRAQTAIKGQPRTIKNNHTPIITEREWEAAQTAPAFTPRKGTGLTVSAHLHGLAYCSGCGRRLSVQGPGKNKRAPRYSCTSAEGCPARCTINVGPLDEYVSGLLQDAATEREPHIAAIIEGDTRYEDAMAEVEKARKLYDEFRDSTELQDDLGTVGFVKALRIRREGLEVARKQLATIKPRIAFPNTLTEPTREEIVTALSMAELARFIERVVIKPAGTGRRLPPSERADVYLIGSEEPYTPPDYPAGPTP